MCQSGGATKIRPGRRRCPCWAGCAESGPARPMISGRRLDAPAGMCSTTSRATGRVGGSDRATLISASTPPAEAPSTATRAGASDTSRSRSPPVSGAAAGGSRGAGVAGSIEGYHMQPAATGPHKRSGDVAGLRQAGDRPREVVVTEAFRQLVVLGASAGGIDVLTAILSRIPDGFGAPILIAQHLDPQRPSHLAEILGRHTTIPVHPVEGATSIEDGHAYVLAANGGIEVQIGELRPIEDAPTRPSPSIDRLLSSAAESYGEGLTAVILTGSGSDGAAGARQVAAAGGTIVVQNPETASHRSMPEAISPSIVDIVADAEAIGPLLVELVSSPRTGKRDPERALRSFLASIRERGGIDFSTYKRGTILRRLQRRMLATGSEDLRAYRRYVDENPDEFNRLTSSFLIKVTEFFRDGDLFERLREDVLPRLIDEAHGDDRELRVWSAGCATGEEAYSLAILIAELLGDRLPEFNVRIFATDVDGDAVSFARRGSYAAGVLESVPEDIRS